MTPVTAIIDSNSDVRLLPLFTDSEVPTTSIQPSTDTSVVQPSLTSSSVIQPSLPTSEPSLNSDSNTNPIDISSTVQSSNIAIASALNIPTKNDTPSSNSPLSNTASNDINTIDTSSSIPLPSLSLPVSEIITATA
jgi:hypothetical protein